MSDTSTPLPGDADAGLRWQRADGLVTLTLDRPGRRNAIDEDLAAAIERACDRVDDDEAVGAVVIRGAGGYFCSGGDLPTLAGIAADPVADEAVRALSQIYRSFTRVTRLRVPSVSVVEGGAIGAGVNLALATDIMLMTPDAVLDSGFLARALHPGGGHLSLLHRAGGRPLAMAAAAFGRPVTGEEAAVRGVCWASVPADQLDANVAELVRRPAADPLLARAIKSSAELELGPPAVPLPGALEIERGPQLWSFARGRSTPHTVP